MKEGFEPTKKWPHTSPLRPRSKAETIHGSRQEKNRFIEILERLRKWQAFSAFWSEALGCL